MSVDRQCKIVLIGDGSVGKSSLIARFRTEGFAPRYHQTVGVDLNSDVLANGQKAIENSVAKMNSRKATKNPDFDAPAATEETLARLSYASTVDAVAQCDLIVEAIVEPNGGHAVDARKASEEAAASRAVFAFLRSMSIERE